MKGNEIMRKLIYDCMKNKQIKSVHIIAKELGLEEMDVLRIVLAFQKEGIVAQCPPAPLNGTNDESCYYTVVAEYRESSCDEVDDGKTW